jgi:double zinc ribbon protein
MRPPRNSRIQGGGCMVASMPQKLTPTDLARLDTDRPFRIGSALSGAVAKRSGLRSRFRRLANRVFSAGATRCPTCDQRNAADSRYCSACGGTLHLPPHLASCPRCGVVGQVTATVCFWCNGPLPGRKPEANVGLSPAARISRRLLRQPPLVIAGTAALAAIVIVGYATTRERSPTEAPLPPAASSETSRSGAPVETPPPAASSETSRGGAPVETPPPAEALEVKTAAPPVARPQAINTGRAGERKPPQPEPCTEAVAALGLCAAKGEAATARPAIEHPRTTDVGKAGEQGPADPRACTEAAAALGLCTPKPIQRRD